MAYPLIGNNNQLLTNLGTGSSIFRPTVPGYSNSPVGSGVLAPRPAASASSYDQQLAALQGQVAASEAELRRIQAQQAAAPKIYSYNVADASAKARAAATNAVNPYYTQQLNKFLEAEQLKQQRAREDAATGNQQVDQALSDALAASGTSRERTAQDTTTKLADVANASDYYQNTEGNTFDKARSALLGNLAQGGLTTSGLGQQQANEQVANRNVESGQQTRAFNVQTDAINTLKKRTFEDLQTGDTQNTRNAGQKKQGIQVDLDRAIQDAENEYKGNAAKNEYDRLQALTQEEGRQYALGVNQFIQALVGKGARAQDIQATRAAIGA
jgi:hypothetical protein